MCVAALKVLGLISKLYTRLNISTRFCVKQSLQHNNLKTLNPKKIKIVTFSDILSFVNLDLNTNGIPNAISQTWPKCGPLDFFCGP
jgi:hypothetical protein